MMDTSTARLLLIASICLPLIARPGQASGGSAATEAELVQEESAQVQAPDDSAAEAIQTGVEDGGVDTPDAGKRQVLQAKPIDMDRSGWPVIVITPADGSVTHNPTYMGNPPMGEDIVTPLNAPDPVWQIQEALAGAKAGNINGENLLDLGVQPFIGLARIFIIPARAVFERPWADVTSP